MYEIGNIRVISFGYEEDVLYYRVDFVELFDDRLFGLLFGRV